MKKLLVFTAMMMAFATAQSQYNMNWINVKDSLAIGKAKLKPVGIPPSISFEGYSFYPVGSTSVLGLHSNLWKAVHAQTVFADTLKSSKLLQIAALTNANTFYSPRGIVTFIFDDGFKTDLNVAFPLFQSKGVVAASAVVPDTVGDANMMTWSDLNTLQNAGWEIMNHSKAHIGFNILNPQQLDDAIRIAKDTLNARGFVAENFAYPGGVNNDTIRAITRRYHRSGRGIGRGVNDATIHQYSLMAIDADDHTQLASHISYLDSAKAKAGWVIYYFHSINFNDSAAIATLIDSAVAKGLNILTPSKALDSIGNMIDADKFAVGKNGARINGDIYFLNEDADGKTNYVIGSIGSQARQRQRTPASFANIKFLTDATTWTKGAITFEVATNDGTDPTGTGAIVEALRIDGTGLTTVKKGLTVTGGTTTTAALSSTTGTFSSGVTSSKSYSNTSDLQVIASGAGNTAGYNIRTLSGGRFSIATGYSGSNFTDFLVGTGTNNPTTTAIYINHSNGNVYLGSATTPSAVLHLKAGNAGASTAPLKFTSGTVNTTAEAGAVEYDGTNFFGTNSTATRFTFAKTLTNTATLDFGSTAAQTSSELTITVTGAADGDVVSLGVPNSASNANSCYTARVSATNTVTVKFNNYSSGAIDPASSIFRVSILKY